MNQAQPRKWFDRLGLISVLDTVRCLVVLHEPPWYGTVCPVVWEGAGGDPGPTRFDRGVYAEYSE